jgi:hypothetical protein
MEDINELKAILKILVSELAKSAIEIEVLDSGATDRITARQVAAQRNHAFYSSLCRKIDDLK